MSQAVAVAPAIASALTLGIADVAVQRSAKLVKTRRALSPRILVDLARQPLWLIAIAANIVGFGLQVVALDLGSLALVEPIIVCDLLFAVLILAYLPRQAGVPDGAGGGRTPAIFAGVAATAAGVAGFLVIGDPSPGRNQASIGMLPALAVFLAAVVGGCLFAAARNSGARPLALALACGVSYGTAAFVVKLVTSEFGGGPALVFASWPIYVFAIVGPAGFILNQDAVQQDKILAPVQAIITSADPVIAIALGVIWLGVRLRDAPVAIVGEIASFLLLITGVAITARYSPMAAGARPAGDEGASRPQGDGG